MASSSSSTTMNSPCAACKFLRRKCTPGCVFAPYFPPDQPAKFANVHRVFGASNVAKLLNDLSSAQREDAVNSLAYEAEARLRDPVYGCVGYISILQHRLKQLQQDLDDAKKELSSYVGPSSTCLPNPFLVPAPAQQPVPPQLTPAHQFHDHQQHPAPVDRAPPAPSSLSVVPYGMHSHAAAAAMGLGLPHVGSSPPALLVQHQQYHTQQIMEVQRLAAAAAAREHQEMLLRGYDQQQQQQDLLRYGGGMDAGCTGGTGAGSGGLSYLGGMVSVAGPLSGLALSSHPFDNPFHSNVQHHLHFQEQQQQHHHQRQHPHQQQTRQHDQRRVAGDGVRSGGGGDGGTTGLPS